MKYVEKHESWQTVGESSESRSITVEIDGLVLESEFLLDWTKRRIDEMQELPK